MSTSYSKELKFKHGNDCVQMGCPGHKMRIAYHHTSDTISVEIDNDPRAYTFDKDVLELIVKLYQESGKGHA